MNIFKNGNLTKNQFFSNIMGLIISLLVWGFSLDMQFPGDTLSELGGFHKILNIVFVISAILYLAVSIGKSTDQTLDWDFRLAEDEESFLADGGFKRSMKRLIFFILLITIGVNLYSGSSKVYNKSIIYKNDYSRIEFAKKTYYDNMWKSYRLKDNILVGNKETFLAVTKLLMESRKDGMNITWKWMQENQPIPYSEFTKFYSDLSTFVESQRKGYLALEDEAQKVANSHNTLLDTLPNNIYNKAMRIERINYESSFSSDSTNTVFKNKIENIK